MASSQNIGNPTQNKICRCAEKDKNIWTTTSENNADKQAHSCPNCQVFKSGPLFISSKGIGWTSWKKRWFILTRTSLVFFRSDPNTPAQKGGESNLTLGGIDLNNSGSVVVRADKKLLTVLFPGGRDGRAFTLKAETSEDLQEWKTALENALAQAPSAALAMGQNGVFRNDMADSIEAAFEQWRDKQPVKSSVVGRPILLALEDIDGSPSFLEKAFRFIEQYGIKVEGILRQSADVEEVERRVHEYEQGKTEFSSDEDAHVIGDCIKHVLRELPSSPIPASCCTALVEAYRTDRGSRINAMRAAICETFPEPNLRLVQRILNMMRTVSSYKNENRMSLSALAACMAPLLLRPLLAGDCEFEDNFNMGGDGSIQLLQAAAAANHAQAIVIILLEDYEKIFEGDSLQDGSSASDVYSESEDGDIDDEESTDDDILEDDEYQDEQNDTEAEIEDGHESTSSGTLDESSSELESDLSGNEDVEDDKANSAALVDNAASKVCQTLSDTTTVTLLQQDINQESSPRSISQHDAHINDIFQCENSKSLAIVSQDSNEASGHVATSTSTVLKSVDHTLPSNVAKSAEKSNEPVSSSKRPTVWGRTSARKNLSMESIDYSSDDEIAIKKLEMTKSDLQTKITKEVKGNAILQESLEKRKEALRERRLALEQDVERLREQLQREKDLRASLESGLMNLRPGQLSPITPSMNSKARADLEEIALAEADVISLKHKVADLRVQLGHQMQHNYASLCEACSRPLSTREPLPKNSQKKYVAVGSSLHQNDAQSMSEDGLSGETLAVQAQMINLHSLPNQDSSQKEKPESTSCSNTKSLGFNGTSSTPTSTPWMSLSDKTHSTRDENAFIQAQREDLEARVEDSSPSPKGDPRCRLQGKTSNQNDKAHVGVRSSAHSEEPNTAVSKTTSKKTILISENCMIGADSENMKNQVQNSQSSPEKQPPHKQETNKTSSSKSLRSNSNSSIDESGSSHRNSASKKSSSSGENVKKNNEDSACSTNRHSSQKQQANTGKSTSERSLGCNNSSSSEEPLAAGHTPTSRRSCTREDAAVSSSALTRLTNRLNFLKERRVQLVNELQNLDSNRTSVPERPCLSENTR